MPILQAPPKPFVSLSRTGMNKDLNAECRKAKGHGFSFPCCEGLAQQQQCREAFPRLCWQRQGHSSSVLLSGPDPGRIRNSVIWSVEVSASKSCWGKLGVLARHTQGWIRSRSATSVCQHPLPQPSSVLPAYAGHQNGCSRKIPLLLQGKTAGCPDCSLSSWVG